MRKLLIVLATVLLFSSCTKVLEQKVDFDYVYDSDWHLRATPVAMSARTLGAADQAYIDEFNAANNDSQLFVMDEPTAPEDGPDARVTIAYSDTNEPRITYDAVPRELVVNNRAGWNADLEAAEAMSGRPCTLYVDKDPPPVVAPPPPPAPLLWTAIVDRTIHVAYYSSINATEADAISRARDLQLEIDLIQVGRAGDAFLPMQYDDWYVYRGATEVTP